MLAVLLAGSANAAGFGVRGQAGYAGSLSGQSYGSNVSSGGSYASSIGSGLAYALEGLYSMNANLEFGLGVHPIGTDVKETSTYTNAVAGTVSRNDSTLKFSTMPVIATAYLKAPVAGKLDLFAGFGLGYAMGGDLVTSDGTFNSVGGVSAGTTSRTSTSTMDGTVAYRAVLGAEYPLTKSFSIFGALGTVAADFSPSKAVTTQSNTNGAGAVTSTNHTTITYQAAAPAKSSTPTSSYTDNRVGGTGTTVSNSNDGVTNSTNTATFVSFTQTRSDTVITSTAQKSATWDVQPLSFQVGGTFRF